MGHERVGVKERESSDEKAPRKETYSESGKKKL